MLNEGPFDRSRCEVRDQREHNLYAAHLCARCAAPQPPSYGGTVWLPREDIACTGPL
jgi:hypothetical protein